MKKLLAAIIIFGFITTNLVYAMPPNVSAKAAVVMDVDSRRILFSKNIDMKLPMASTTKIMTAIVALENSKLDEKIKASRRAAYIEGSSIWLEENEEITMENALYGLMLNSGNDAAVAIAEHIAGSEENFAKLMTKKAMEIGALNTRFDNPHGLHSDDHYTTAYDLALITAYAMKNPKFSEIVKTKTKNIPWQGHQWDRKLKNHNKLLWQYEFADGVKTGFTKKAGRCLVSSATKEGWQIVAVTLNAGNDWNDHKSMLEYAFNTYKPKTIINKGDYMKSVGVNNGKKDIISLKSSESFKIPLQENEENNISINYNGPDSLNAPINQQQNAGSAEIILNNKIVGKVGLSPEEYIEEQSSVNEFSKILQNWFLIFNNDNHPVKLNYLET